MPFPDRTSRVSNLNPVPRLFEKIPGQYPGDFGTASEDINCRCDVIMADSASEDKMRDSKSFAKAEQKDRTELTFSRQLRSMFREQGQSVIEVIERKGNG